MSQKASVVILGNENVDDNALWIKACEEKKVNYQLVNLTENDSLEKIASMKFDYLLAKPSCRTAKFKRIYDERISILNRTLGNRIYPSPQEIFIYENKIVLSKWLSENKIPHPNTNVFFNKSEAITFCKQSNYPIVAKLSIGASGRGVQILKTQTEASNYIDSVFSGKGVRQSVGPNLEKGNILKRVINNVLNPIGVIKKIKKYSDIYGDKQTDFVLFQEFIPHDFEWRVVRIGNSFFAHKKIVKNKKASGSLIKGYENPPLELFNFVKRITDEHQMFSQAVDIFEQGSNYLVNEMQCIFGQSDSYQMLVNGKKGRYIYSNDNWVFEEGDFNKNECYNLRLDWVLQQISLYKK